MPEAFLARLPFETWTALQDHFENIFMARGGPADCALFVRTTPRQDAEIALFAPDDQMPFYAVPGEWTRGRAEGDGWGLLVGHHNAAARFGVTLGESPE